MEMTRDWLWTNVRGRIRTETLDNVDYTIFSLEIQREVYPYSLGVSHTTVTENLQDDPWLYQVILNALVARMDRQFRGG